MLCLGGGLSVLCRGPGNSSAINSADNVFVDFSINRSGEYISTDDRGGGGPFLGFP